MLELIVFSRDFWTLINIAVRAHRPIFTNITPNYLENSILDKLRSAKPRNSTFAEALASVTSSS